jgi:HAD superfamily hydrolase (TIGR01509 family)
MFRAVCFDIGGVLIRIHHEWSGALRAAGVACDRDLGPLGGFNEFEGYQAGSILESKYIKALAIHLDVDQRVAMDVHMAILREEYEGVSNLIQELTDDGIVCGCLSNTNASHWSTFFDGARYRFGPRLSVRIGSHIERANKPAPEIYAAFEREARVSPNEIVYFDDGLLNVAAAKQRGWSAHLIDPAGDTAAQMRALLLGP